MADNNAVDLENAPIEEGAPKAEPKKTPVDVRPMGIMDAVGVKKSAEASDVLSQALGADQKPDQETVSDPNASVPTEITAEVRETIDDPDLHINQIYMGKKDVQVLDKVLHTLYPTEEAQQKAAKDPTSLFNLLIKALRDGWGSNQMQSLVDCVTEKGPNGKAPVDSLTPKSDKSVGPIGDGITHDIHNAKVDLTGDEARDAFMASISGLKKVKLLNSGFWVTIRRPFIYELQEIFDAADMEQREVGYSIGPHFALVADLYIKKRFIESLLKYHIIRDSNLENIFDTKNNVFMKALAFHDYEVLVQAVLSLMTRKGVRARIACPECHKSMILDKIDINSSIYVNRDLITPDMSAWWNAKVDDKGKKLMRKLKDIEVYRKQILGFKHDFIEEFEFAKIRATLREPSMFEYFTIGETLVSKIQEIVDERSTDDENRRRVILANLAAHSYHMLTPWVEKIEQIDDNGNVTKRTTDYPTILSLFDITMQENSMRPLIELNKMLAKSKISYVGTFALECPSCHAKPDVGANQFYPLEVQTIFFGQLFRQLPAELMRQES